MERGKIKLTNGVFEPGASDNHFEVRHGPSKGWFHIRIPFGHGPTQVPSIAAGVVHICKE